ncbi:hypothetical protein KA005_40935 [bacterium]|nr:hypothetical protein [bacterium]
MKWFLDMDGVIVDFIVAVIKFHNLKCTPNDIKGWGGMYNYWDGTEEEFWQPLDESFWMNLPFTPEGPEIIDLLAPFKPTILSSPVRNCAGGKQKWIQKNLPEYYDHGRYILSPNKSILAHPGSVLIDDAEHYIDEWVAAGGQGILVPQPWNRNRNQNTLDWVTCAVRYMEGLH